MNRLELHTLRTCIGAGLTACLLGVPAAFAAGGGESALQTTPIPIAVERDAQLAYEDVGNFKTFTDAIRKGAAENAESPSAHIWDLLPLALREDMERWEFEESYPQDLKDSILKGFNGALRRKDFYNPEVWDASKLSSGLQARLADLENQNSVEVSRTNRLLLFETYPELVSTPEAVTFVERPDTIHIYGDKFLDRGQLKKPITLWTGTVWQPSFFAFGTYRTVVQTFDTGGEGDGASFTENAHRLDVFLNLALTPTERVVISFRPLDGPDGFTRYDFDDVDTNGDGVNEIEKGWHSETDLEPETLFFEGDFGELFPFLDPEDKGAFDLGFAVGRQPLFFGNGFLVEDTMDAVGITKNNLVIPGTSNLRITGLYAWNGVNRDRGKEDADAQLYGLFTAWDFPTFSLEADAAAVTSDLDEDGTGAITGGGDSVHLSLGSIQRIGHYSTSFRAAASLADEETPDVGDGVLLFIDGSYTLPYSIDLVYVSVFWAIDNFSSAARRAVAQGPLARAGILFEGPGLGRVGSALANQAKDVAGGALGYQMFFNDSRTQLIAEIGGRVDTSSDTVALGGNAYGAGLRLQHAIGQHWIVRADAAGAVQEEGDPRLSAGAGLVLQF